MVLPLPLSYSRHAICKDAKHVMCNIQMVRR